MYSFFNCLSWVDTKEAPSPKVNEISHRFFSQLSKCYSNFWDKITKKVDFLDMTTYFRFLIVLNLWYCIFLKFLMVTEKSSCKSQELDFSQESWNLLKLNCSLWLTIIFLHLHLFWTAYVFYSEQYMFPDLLVVERIFVSLSSRKNIWLFILHFSEANNFYLF
jgi:hypothetical protein